MKQTHPPVHKRTLFLIACAGIISVGVMAYTQWGAIWVRQNTVRIKGSQIMPFDILKTTHIFTPLDNGGLQQVVVKDPYDKTNILLIQQHLQMEAERFGKGDYADPAFIHGMNMAGLSDMAGAATKITITYNALANGAQITYVSEDPQLVNAIHDWFMAQRMDHGSDAMM